MLNKNIVHLINDIFWNMLFKGETQAGKVMHVIPIACLISIISIIHDIPIAHIMSIISIIRGLCESPGESLRDFHWRRRGFSLQHRSQICYVAVTQG